MSWVLVKIVGNTLANPDGRVRSLNPASDDPPYGPYHWEDRPAGTAGGYEQVGINGGTVNYNPSGKEVLVFGFQEKVAHSDGMSAMTEDPIQIETVPL